MAVEPWSRAPDRHVRKTKRATEKELLIKVGAKKEVIECHPLIISSRVGRAQPFVSLNYSRAQPPALEKSSQMRNPWSAEDPALRQMSNPARRGPRDVILPNLVKAPVQVQVFDVPLTDIEYHARRAVATERLTQLLSKWTVYNQVAFPELSGQEATRSDLDPGMSISKRTLIHLAHVQPNKVAGANWLSRENSLKIANHPVPKSRRKKNRWKALASELLLQLKASHMRLPRQVSRSELRIYVSSTPDVQEEREFLEEVAYPKLREFCEQLCLNCHVIDLRNGAGQLTNDLETFDLIEKELYSCRRLSVGPYFVSLIGHVLDDQSLPGFLPKSVYEEIRGTLIRENIPGVETFDEVYRLDSNRVTPVYIKQPVCAVHDYQSPEEIERALHEVLTQASSAIVRSKESTGQSKVDLYTWSAVVKELDTGLLKSAIPSSDTLCFMMDSDFAEEEVSQNDTPIRRLRHSVYNHYCHSASKDNLVNFKTGKKSMAFLRSLSDTFLARVSSLLKCRLRQREYDIRQQLTDGSETVQHVGIAVREAASVNGHDRIVSEMQKIVQRSDPSPKTILLWGQSGVGKTAVLSQVAKASVLWDSRRKVVFRCLGTTLRSSSLFRVLESLISQLTLVYALDIELPSDISLQGMVSLFCYCLADISAKREIYGNLFLVLDQLENLFDLDAHYLLSIMNALSEGTTLLLSLQTPHLLTKALTSHKTVVTVTSKGMNRNEVRTHLTKSLSSIKRVLTSDQLESALSTLPSESNPLHAQMLFQIVRWWPSHTVPELKPFSNDAEVDFDIFLECIESDLGGEFTRYALSLLASARYGLADQEILHLLSKDPELLDEIKKAEECVSVVEGFPYQLQLSRLLCKLGSFVTNVKLEGETIHQISSKLLKDVITTKYMNGTFFHTVHQKLTNFFLFFRRGLLLSSNHISEQKHRQLSKYHLRTLRCVPYHLCQCSPDTAVVWKNLKEKVFLNFAWLVNEVYAGFFQDLLDDISYALGHVSLDPNIQYLQQMLLASRHTLVHNPLSLAAIFASQMVDDDDVQNVKATLPTVVHDARVWLRQIHLQILVPVSYTSGKFSRLLVKDRSIFNIKDVKLIPGTGRLLVQRKRTLSVLDMLSSEEVPLVTRTCDIMSFHFEDEGRLLLLTQSSLSKSKAEIVDLLQGKQVKTLPLADTPLLWFEFRSTKIYFAVESGVKSLNVDTGSISTVLATKKPWKMSCLSASKPEIIITLLIEEKTKIECFPVHDVLESKSVRLKNEIPNKNCTPLLSTKDGKYIIYITERQVVVIDMPTLTVKDTYSHKGLPIIRAAFSRSHEHIFLAYANGTITCHVLYSGNRTLVTKLESKLESQMVSAQKSRDRSKRNNDEMITFLVTSEDDHFLFCGTQLGHVCVVHVPTGLQLVDIFTQQGAIGKIVYLTDRDHFQHIITISTQGLSRYWNMRPLLKKARLFLKEYITDSDLQKEEESKLDLSHYFSMYEERRYNKIFLNGPDVAAFFQHIPEGILDKLAQLDPAFDIHTDWEITGSFADLSEELVSLVCGHELGDVVLTVSSDFRLARWSLQDGTFVWSKRLHCHGDTIHNMASVYYDQAVLLVLQSRQGQGYEVLVIYTGEGQNKVMSRDNVLLYWISVDRTRVILKCEGTGQQNTGNTFFMWDLINTKEKLCAFTDKTPVPGWRTVTRFSPSLQHSISLVLPAADADITTPVTRAHHPFKSPCLTSQPEVDPSASNCASNPAIRHFSEMRPCVSQSRMCEFHVRPDSVHIAENGSEKSASPIPGTGSPTLLSSPQPLGRDGKAGPFSPEKTSVTNLCWSKISTESKMADNDKRLESVKMKEPFPYKRLSPCLEKDETWDSLYSNGSTPDFIVHTKSENCSSGKHGSAEIVQKNEDNIAHVEHTLQLQVTNVCFVQEVAVLVGTKSGHLIMLAVPSFDIISVLSEEGPLLTDKLTGPFLKGVAPLHKSAITSLLASADGHMLISSDGRIVCVWKVLTKTLNMKIDVGKEQEISSMVISSEAAIIALVTNKNIIRLWTPLEQREIASYMTTFDITDLQMSCDCRKVLVRGIGIENTPVLEIFEVRNVDDILIQVASRKESQQHERRDKLADERRSKTNAQISGNKNLW